MKPKTKLKPIFQTSITEDVKYTWMRKEEGSYEDKGRPDNGHVYCILANSPKCKIICYTEDEKSILLKSADYQTSWDKGDSDSVDNLIKTAERILRNSLKH